MHLLPVSPGLSVLPIPTAMAPPNLPLFVVSARTNKRHHHLVQHCSVHITQRVNTGGPLAVNKSARAMLGPPDTALLHVCRSPRPVVVNRPSSGACCVGLGCAPQLQPKTATCDLSADTPHPATARTSHGTAAAMRARIAGPSITHSSNKAWLPCYLWRSENG